MHRLAEVWFVLAISSIASPWFEEHQCSIAIEVATSG